MIVRYCDIFCVFFCVQKPEIQCGIPGLCPTQLKQAHQIVPMEAGTAAELDVRKESKTESEGETDEVEGMKSEDEDELINQWEVCLCFICAR